MDKPLTLYYAPDNASLCVRLALEALEMPYQTMLVDRARQGQKTPDYLALNPNGLIPVLLTPFGAMYETGAILLWLADQQPGAVFPAPDAPDRPQALTRLFWLSNTLHPALRMLFYPDQYIGGDTESLRVSTRKRIAAYLDQLAQDADIFDPDHATLLGCYLAPLLRWPALYGGSTIWYDLAQWPALFAFAQRFEATPAAMRAAKAEGLGPAPFSAPIRPNPPEGSAT